MARPALEVADIFRDHGPAWRGANRGHVSLGQLKVMSAIERCRTAALGGHVARCENEACGHTVIAYNSCRNRHCPKCQGAAAREWMAARAAELLPVPYFHVVFTLPAAIGDIAYQNNVNARLKLPENQRFEIAMAVQPARSFECPRRSSATGLHRRSLGGKRGPGDSPLSRPQPPEAGAEGQSLQGTITRPRSVTQSDDRVCSCRDAQRGRKMSMPGGQYL